MSQLRLIRSGTDAKSVQSSHELPQGPLAALFLVLRGTTDTAQTLALADIGSFRLQRNGVTIMSAPFEFFHDWADKVGGNPEATTPTAGATRVFVPIPMFLPGLPNVMEIRDITEAEAFLDWNTSTLATRFGANTLTWELYGLYLPDVPETYTLVIDEYNVAAVNGEVIVNLQRANIQEAFYRDASAVLDKLTWSIDGGQVVDNVPADVLRNVDDAFSRVESGTHNYKAVRVNYRATPDLAAGLNVAHQFRVVGTGSGTVNLVFVRTLASDVAPQSLQRARTFRQAQVSKSTLRVARAPAGATLKS